MICGVIRWARQFVVDMFGAFREPAYKRDPLYKRINAQMNANPDDIPGLIGAIVAGMGDDAVVQTSGWMVYDDEDGLRPMTDEEKPPWLDEFQQQLSDAVAVNAHEKEFDE
jgi:hypothetical protein